MELFPTIRSQKHYARFECDFDWSKVSFWPFLGDEIRHFSCVFLSFIVLI
jgi:hypothetical protein